MEKEEDLLCGKHRGGKTDGRCEKSDSCQHRQIVKGTFGSQSFTKSENSTILFLIFHAFPVRPSIKFLWIHCSSLRPLIYSIKSPISAPNAARQYCQPAGPRSPFPKNKPVPENPELLTQKPFSATDGLDYERAKLFMHGRIFKRCPQAAGLTSKQSILAPLELNA